MISEWIERYGDGDVIFVDVDGLCYKRFLIGYNEFYVYVIDYDGCKFVFFVD